MEDGRCHIAIIDDGINLSNYAPPFMCYVDFVNGANTEEYIKHSYIVTQIIRKYNTECIISSIKIIDEHGNGDINNLIKAIYWCIENDIDVIHLSIGSTHFADFSRLYTAIVEASAQNIIIVASQCNESIFTVPACLDLVIGVRSSDECKPGEFIIRYDNWDGIDIIASSRFVIDNQIGKPRMIASSNSFASPYITALVAKIIAQHGKKKKDLILAYLEHCATDIRGKAIQEIKQGSIYSPFEDFVQYSQRMISRRLCVYKNASLPILLVDDNKLHEKLFNHFISAGYNCYPVILESPNISLESIRHFLAFIEMKYAPDMFIILAGNNLVPNYDMHIKSGQDFLIIYKNGNQIEIPKNQLDNLIKNIMQNFS